MLQDIRWKYTFRKHHQSICAVDYSLYHKATICSETILFKTIIHAVYHEVFDYFREPLYLYILRPIKY